MSRTGIPGLVTIEFTEDTQDADGNPKRSAGDKLLVDKRQAEVFVKRGHAKLYEPETEDAADVELTAEDSVAAAESALPQSDEGDVAPTDPAPVVEPPALGRRNRRGSDAVDPPPADETSGDTPPAGDD